MVTGVIEMDRDGKIVKPACCALHNTGLLFGQPNLTLNRSRIHNYIQLPRNAHADVFMKDEKVKGAMKRGTTGKKIGSLKVQ
jgi:hypothetical protein